MNNNSEENLTKSKIIKGHKDVISKKPIKKIQVKVKCQENATKGSNEEFQHPHVNNSDMEQQSETDHAANDHAPPFSSTTLELASCEVTVGV
jgi:hypothetical protein